MARTLDTNQPLVSHRTFSTAASESTPTSATTGQFPTNGASQVQVSAGALTLAGTSITSAYLNIAAISGSNVAVIGRINLGTTATTVIVSPTTVQVPANAKLYVWFTGAASSGLALSGTVFLNCVQ